jgi:hypothetical protein
VQRLKPAVQYCLVKAETALGCLDHLPEIDGRFHSFKGRGKGEDFERERKGWSILAQAMPLWQLLLLQFYCESMISAFIPSYKGCFILNTSQTPLQSCGITCSEKENSTSVSSRAMSCCGSAGEKVRECFPCPQVCPARMERRMASHRPLRKVCL